MTLLFVLVVTLAMSLAGHDLVLIHRLKSKTMAEWVPRGKLFVLRRIGVVG